MTDDKDLRDFDRSLHAAQARISGGLSPASLALAAADWAMHLAGQPGRQTALAASSAPIGPPSPAKCLGLHTETLTPEPGDHRFADPGWQHGPAAFAAQAFLRAERFWDMATTAIPGVSQEQRAHRQFCRAPGAWIWPRPPTCRF